jgi:low affinity Fe/Cu permease
MADQKSNNGNGQSTFDRIGCMVSGWVADLSATPAAQVAVILVCSSWFLIGWNSNVLTAILSIIAITLTQMVLNQQKERETDAHRRDVAMHAKLDELVASMKGARNDLVGIEEKEEEEIVQLKDEVKEAIEETPAAANPVVRETAKKAVEEAAEGLKQQARKTGNGRKPAKKAAGSGR